MLKALSRLSNNNGERKQVKISVQEPIIGTEKLQRFVYFKLPRQGTEVCDCMQTQIIKLAIILFFNCQVFFPNVTAIYFFQCCLLHLVLIILSCTDSVTTSLRNGKVRLPFQLKNGCHFNYPSPLSFAS